VAEDIRMGAAKSVVDSYSDSDVSRFNAMVDSYNSRCGSFRYRQGALESARRDIEPFRNELQLEGKNRIVRNSAVESTGSSVAEPAETLRETFLNETLIEALQIKPGTSERRLESSKAIIAFAKAGYVNLKPDERIDYSDYRLLKKPVILFGQEIVVIDEEYFDGYIGCCVSPGIAVTVKINGSLDKMKAFAAANQCKLSLDSDENYFGPQIPIPSAPPGTYAKLSCKERDAL
jgi:hypothetical protein